MRNNNLKYLKMPNKVVKYKNFYTFNKVLIKKKLFLIFLHSDEKFICLTAKYISLEIYNCKWILFGWYESFI